MSPTFKHPYPADPLRLIHVKGKDREMGRQHAEQVGEAIKKGMPVFYYRLWKRLTALPTERVIHRLAQKGAQLILDKVFVRRLLRSAPSLITERIQGMAEAANISYQEFATALVLPDLMPLLQAEAGNWGLVSFVNGRYPVQFGCSSFIASGKNFLVGRNLDFPGVSYWDRYPVLQLTEPVGKLRYIGITSAGVPLGGISGINEAQISVSLHQHYGRITRLSGEPPFCVGERILSEARSLSQAVEIVRSAKFAGSWAFILSDGKTREGKIIEVHPKALGELAIQDGILTHSNCFQSVECKPSEYSTGERMNWDNASRKDRLAQRIREGNGALTMESAVPMLGEHFDPFWGEQKIVNRTVAQVYNIQSFVIDPENMQLALAVGDCPVQLRRYQKVDLGEIFSGRQGITENYLMGFEFADPEMKRAREEYILSFVSAFDGDFMKAEHLLTESVASSFAPESSMVLGLLKLKRRDYSGSMDCLVKAREWIEKKKQQKGISVFPPEYFEICLYEARVTDLMGHRPAALKKYAEVAKHPGLQDKNLRQIAERGGPYKVKDLDKIVMPYSSYIPFR